MSILQTNQVRSVILVALSGALYGTLGFFGMKILEDGLSVLCMSFWRYAVAFIFISFINLRGLRSAKFTVTRGQFVSLLLNGLVFYALSSNLYFYSSVKVGTGLAMVLFYAYPLFVTFLSWKFQGEKLTKMTLLSLVMISLGLIFLSGGQEVRSDFLGILAAISSGFLYAYYLFRSKREVHSTPSVTSTQLVCLGAMLSSFFICLADGSFAVPTSFQAWFHLLGIGTIGTSIPILLLLKGMRWISTTQAAILSALEPLMTVLMGVLLLGEVLHAFQWFGAAILVLGAALAQSSSGRAVSEA